jgi:hypothetical protein
MGKRYFPALFGSHRMSVSFTMFHFFSVCDQNLVYRTQYDKFCVLSSAMHHVYRGSKRALALY